MSLSPFASLRFYKPHATTALENECSSSIREIILGLGARICADAANIDSRLLTSPKSMISRHK
jgi:hypothetical protein